MEFEKETLKKREKCRKFVKDSIVAQMEDGIKWGIMTDWRHSYFTMSNIILSSLVPAYESMVLKSFAKLHDKGLVARKHRTVLWSVND